MILQIIFSLLISIGIFFLAFNFEIKGLGLGSNINALIIVLGGTSLTTIIFYPWGKLALAAQLIKKSLLYQNENEGIIKTIVNLARTYRQDGIRGLEQKLNKLSPGLVKTAVKLITYQCGRSEMERVLQKEVEIAQRRYQESQKILHNTARITLFFGLAGTVVNFIRIFGLLNSANLFQYLAVVFLNAFYGVFLANFILFPLSQKFKKFLENEFLRLDMIREGMLDLYKEENSKAIQYKLEAITEKIKTTLPWSPLELALMTPERRVTSIL